MKHNQERPFFPLSLDSISRQESEGRNVIQALMRIFVGHIPRTSPNPAVFPHLADLLPDFIGASLAREMIEESSCTLGQSSKLEILFS